MGLKKGCDFTSDAPAREPRRRSSSLLRSLRITDLQRLDMVSIFVFEAETSRTYFETCVALVWSGNGTSSFRMFANVALRFLPLKGVVPKSIS